MQANIFQKIINFIMSVIGISPRKISDMTVSGSFDETINGYWPLNIELEQNKGRATHPDVPLYYKEWNPMKRPRIRRTKRRNEFLMSFYCKGLTGSKKYKSNLSKFTPIQNFNP